MKMIIDIPEGMLEAIKDGYWSGSHKLELAIRNGIPYEDRPQGDLISREALKKAFEKPFWEKWEWEFICKCIDNAPTVSKKDLQKIFYETAEKPELKEVIAYECGKASAEREQGKRAEGALLIIDRLYIEGYISNTEQGILRRAILLPEKGGADND